MAGITKKVTLVSITPGAKSDVLKVTLALDEDEITFSAHVDKVHIAEDESFNLIRFDLVFDHFFYSNKHIVHHVTKAVDDFCASKPVSFPVDLGYYSTVGAMPITTYRAASITGTKVSGQHYYPFGPVRWSGGMLPTDHTFAGSTVQSLHSY